VPTATKIQPSPVRNHLLLRYPKALLNPALALLAFLVFASTPLFQARAADTPSFCDGQIVNTSDKFGYRLRGDRCEGQYQQPSAGVLEALTIVSFACANKSFSISNSRPTIAWPSNEGLPVSIRIDTLPQIRLRYRLDTAVSASNSRYTWDSDTWSALSIEPEYLGIVIKGPAKIGANVFHGTLLQARVGTELSLPDCSAGPTLAVRTGVPITVLKVCTAALAPDGQPVGQPACQTVTGSFFPNKSINVPLGVLKSATHLLQVTLETTPPGPSTAARYYRVKVD
jgi:hypothetical protein